MLTHHHMPSRCSVTFQGRLQKHCMASSAASRFLSSTLTPFLYPCLDSSWQSVSSPLRNVARVCRPRRRPIHPVRCQSTAAATTSEDTPPTIDVNQYDHLNPTPPDYSNQPFADSCTVTLHAGAGGHGCISFLREKYIEYGPPNGGDGGTGGNVYIQAVRGETSLHQLARRPIIKAEKGRNGEGGSRGGKRGEDLLIQVPVGTVVREIDRQDPNEEYTAKQRNKGFGRDKEDDDPNSPGTDQSGKWRRDKWLLYPGALPKKFTDAWFPALPRPRKSNLAAAQPEAPVRLDLDKPMSTPMLLAAGAMGGLGNPHFVTRSIPRPKYATKGEDGVRIQLQLELKLLADVGLVGLPNAGKSTLLRALTRSRTRVGDWAFTTLSPSIGTVVLDSQNDQHARILQTRDGEARTSFTIADIPGLIEDAHLDKGLGLGFLRHIERAGVLAFVVDLSAGDAVAALKGLWREVGEYESLREQELNVETATVTSDEHRLQQYQPFQSSISPAFDPKQESQYSPTLLRPRTGRSLPPLSLPPISSKAWFVVATKADLDATQDNFKQLVEYLRQIQDKQVEHPSGKANAWRQRVYAVPVSALRKEGVESIKDICVEMLGR